MTDETDSRLDKHSIRVRDAEDSIHDLTATQVDQLKWQSATSADIAELRKELSEAKKKRSNNTKLIITLLLAVVPIANAAVNHFWPATPIVPLVPVGVHS